MEEEKTVNKTLLELQLIDAIKESLQNFLIPNATFLAERLLAERDTEEHRSLLADCYMGENKQYKAYHILQQCKSEENRYKLAMACLKLNKLKEAEKALIPSHFADFMSNKYSNQSTYRIENVPNGSYGLYLLGLINEKQQKHSEAKEFFIKCLELNPTIWVAYEKLCKLGEHILPNKIFTEVKYKIYENGKKKTIEIPATQKNTTNSNIMTRSFKAKQIEKPSEFGEIINNPNETEANFESLHSNPLYNKPRLIQSIKNINFGMEPSGNLSLTKTSSQKQVKETNQPHPHHSKKPITGLSKANFNEFPEYLVKSETQSFKDLTTLLKRVAEPFYHMSCFLCQQAIDQFLKLPANQLNTGWVLSNIGRCYMECIKYQDAEKFFAEALRIEPYRLEGIEYYSSCLWHLKKQVELCTLAHDALEKSRFSPEAWIAVGNCFSLQKEHENALKFFNRAIQLNPHNAYAHSLCGHEYVYNEDFQNARKYFENSLNYDIRHYNAWWGLGNINFKQEKYEKAVENFHRAISINANCPILYSYLGMTLTSMRRFSEALKHFDNAELLDPNNVLNRFQKASVLVQLEKYDDALKELEKLKLMMPKEAPIPILMGKIYKKLNKIEKAHHFFTLALDLEPKDNQRIKSLIDSLQNNNEFNEDLEFF